MIPAQRLDRNSHGRILILPPLTVGQTCGSALTSTMASEAKPSSSRGKNIAALVFVRSGRRGSARPTAAVSRCAQFARRYQNEVDFSNALLTIQL